MSTTFTTHMGVTMPALVYGTAWKKQETARLVEMALTAGFRGIDTACQPKHYYEPGVGEGLAAAIKKGVVKREEVYLQTKYSPIDAHRGAAVPYDARAPIEAQVAQSVALSLKNLCVTQIDGLVMHSPLETVPDTLRAWKAMEAFVASGQVRQLGVSNCYDPEVFAAIWDAATVKPSVLQNRFYADSGFDVELRAFCRERKIAYQSFWTLSANPHVLRSNKFKQIAAKRGLTPEGLLYRFMADIGCVPLCGTTDAAHMQSDLVAMAAPSLDSTEIATILALLPARA